MKDCITKWQSIRSEVTRVSRNELNQSLTHDAAVAGNKVAEVLDFESSFEAGREEAAKRRDEGSEHAESGDVVLERAHKHRLNKRF